MTTISFAKVIKKLLSTDNIKKKVGNKVFPLVAELKTDFPYIVFKKEQSNEFNKDSIASRYQQILNYDIIVASDNYDESVEIAELVRESLEFKKGEIEGFNVVSIRLNSSTESYNDAFLQQLTFEFKVNK